MIVFSPWLNDKTLYMNKHHIWCNSILRLWPSHDNTKYCTKSHSQYIASSGMIIYCNHHDGVASNKQNWSVIMFLRSYQIAGHFEIWRRRVHNKHSKVFIWDNQPNTTRYISSSIVVATFFFESNLTGLSRIVVTEARNTSWRFFLLLLQWAIK